MRTGKQEGLEDHYPAVLPFELTQVAPQESAKERFFIDWREAEVIDNVQAHGC